MAFLGISKANPDLFLPEVMEAMESDSRLLDLSVASVPSCKATGIEHAPFPALRMPADWLA
jgi:hypothetical protein